MAPRQSPQYHGPRPTGQSPCTHSAWWGVSQRSHTTMSASDSSPPHCPHATPCNLLLQTAHIRGGISITARADRMCYATGGAECPCTSQHAADKADTLSAPLAASCTAAYKATTSSLGAPAGSSPCPNSTPPPPLTCSAAHIIRLGVHLAWYISICKVPTTLLDQLLDLLNSKIKGGLGAPFI